MDAVTLAETAQLLLAAMEPPVRLMLVAFAVAVKVPPQLLVAFGVLATVSPEGKLSLTATPVSATGLVAGLVMVRVSVEVPPARMGEVPNPLVIVGGASALKVAEAVRPVPPLVELTVPVVLV